MEQVVDHPDRLDGFPPGQRTQSRVDADDLAGTASVHRQRPDQHGLASACPNADVPDRLFPPLRWHRLEGDGKTPPRDQGLHGTGIDPGGRQVRSIALAQAFDRAHQRRTGFVQQPDIINSAVRRQLREIDAEGALIFCLMRAVIEMAGDGQRLRLHLPDDHAVDLVGGVLRTVGFARDQSGDEPRLIFGLLDQGIAREQAHRQRDADDRDADGRGDRDDQSSGEGHRGRSATVPGDCRRRAWCALMAADSQ